MVFAVFGQTLTHEFIDFDDSEYVYNNPTVIRGLTLRGLAWAFSGAHAANWHPLTWLSHMLDCQLYGLHPWGHHLTNVLLHAATVVALFLVLEKMTGALWRSALVAAVFGVHPLRVESVAWIAERKDVLSGLFFVLTIGAYVRYARCPWSWKQYGLVVGLFALDLMSKPMVITLPLVLLLLDRWPLRRTETLGRLILEKIPLLALSGVVSAITLFAQHRGIQSVNSFSISLRLANALVSYMVYLRQMVWPAGLVAFYPYPRWGLPAWQAVMAALLLAGLSGIAVWQWRKRPWIMVGWVWYLVMLLPVAGFIKVGMHSHADRFTYLPQIGIYLAVTWWLSDLGALARIGRLSSGILMGCLVGALMVCAWKQTTYWKDSDTLWARALACNADNEMGHYGVGNYFLKKEKWADAITEYQKALQIRPDFPEAECNLGVALDGEGKVDEAIVHYQRMVAFKPDYADAYYNLGFGLQKQGRMDEAVVQYQKALQLDPDDANVYNNLGLIFAQAGKVDEAISEFQKAIATLPGHINPEINLGTALLQKGELNEAMDHFQKALEITTNSAEAHYGLGNVYLAKGDSANAISEYQQSLQITPGNPEVQNNLAWLLATCADASLRNGIQALQLARRANNLTGGTNPIVLHTLAAAYAEVGQFQDATQTAKKAMDMAQSAGRETLLTKFGDELKRYEVGLPIRQ